MDGDFDTHFRSIQKSHSRALWLIPLIAIFNLLFWAGVLGGGAWLLIYVLRAAGVIQ